MGQLNITIETKDLKVKNLIEMSQTELDALYRHSPIGEIPIGETRGTVIVAPRTPLGRIVAPLARLLFWQGKVFNPAGRDLLNRISPFRFKAIRAKVYVGDSWLDEGEAIVADYSETSFLARKIRDEIREVAPGLYLGKAYWARQPVLNFALSVGDQNR